MDKQVSSWLRRNVKWKKWTPYFQSTLLHIETNEYGRIYTRGDKWYLVNSEGEIGQIPRYVMQTLVGVHKKTEVWGPYIFYNGFENTKEAKYIKKMFKYPELTEVANRKICDIRFNFNLWFEEDHDFTQAMKERLQNEKKMGNR